MQHDFVVLDRSGSMRSMWEEALGAVDTYVAKLASDNVDTGVTLAVFDCEYQHAKMDYAVIRDRITPTTWKKVTSTEIQPRGFTPLNDAVARTVQLALKGPPLQLAGLGSSEYDKVAIIIMTDGLENSSVEYPGDKGLQAVNKMLDECRAKGWQIIFLGANFDNTVQAASFGAHAGQTVAGVTPEKLSMTMRTTATKRSSYGATGQAVSFSEEEKEELKSK